MPLENLEIDWKALIDEASEVQNPKGPKQLLAALSERKNLSSVHNEADAHYRQAYQVDLGAIYRHSRDRQPLSREDREIWIDRLAWLLQELRSSQQQRPSVDKLVVMLRVGAAFSTDVRIWDRLPSECISTNFLAGLAALVGSTRSSFRTRGGLSEPIWEREAVDRFLLADEECDWPAVENLWQTIVPAIWPDADLVEATACLCRFENGRHALAVALDACQSILSSACIIGVIPSQHLGDIAVNLNADRARFALVQCMAFNLPRNEPVSEATQGKLASLFRLVQQNEGEWLKWMRAFNRYPVRTKPLQAAFGKSLVGSAESAKAAYIEAIELNTTPGDCREAVTACLSAFQETAPLEERRVMWRAAFHRWQTWDFDIQRANARLTWMAVSDLDFALIGYGVECLSDSDLEMTLQTLVTELTEVQNRWYSDRVAFDAAWYRTLSRWQVFAYAGSVRSGQQAWEVSQAVLMPFDPKANPYYRMSLGTNLPNGQRW